MKEYVIGKDELPKWIQKKIMIYRSGNGIKLEISGNFKDFVASIGDTLVVDGDWWWILRSDQGHLEQHLEQ